MDGMSLSGYAARTYIKPQHFALTSCGAALGIDNRVEMSYAHQTFWWPQAAAAGLQYERNEEHGWYIALQGSL
jgi:Protein of unknown function (DUF3034)